ncbi:quinon protein alcohol dehydrogenase-like superfamily [Lipomyces kononenkoae]|uniref:Quinon protein alcohol dehydrogenase-like superfamily n=1 Tax=Lipomyces kononenkoae TaxID=34357 RepID=A0ACC3TA72_LIPKO
MSGSESSCSTPRGNGEHQDKNVAAVLTPYLTRHIPERLYPESYKESRNFCYRHHPAFKCKRQADETDMDRLQCQLDALPKQDQQAITHVWSIFSAAPAQERNLILKGLLSQCCSPQLSYVSSLLRELIRIDFVSALPPEVSYKILCYLDASSLCKAAQVSKNWRKLADDDTVWHRMCEQHIDRKCTKCGWGLPLLERRRLKECKKDIEMRVESLSQQSAYTMQLTQTDSDEAPNKKRAIEESSASDSEGNVSQDEHAAKRTRSNDMSTLTSLNVPPDRLTRPWKDVYSERLKVEQNWRRGRYKLKVFNGHTDGIMCLQFDHSVLITGSYDTTVRVWDIETGKQLRVLSGHVRGVRALMFDDSKLVTGSMDRTIRIWNYRTGECVSTLRGHTDGVLSLHFDATLLASGSADSTIRVWNFKEKSFFTLRGHSDWVNAVNIHSPSRMLFSASDDTTVRMWDLDTHECLRVFNGAGMSGVSNDQGHFGQVQCVLPIFLRDEEEDDSKGADDDDDVNEQYHHHHHYQPVNGHQLVPDGGEYKEQEPAPSSAPISDDESNVHSPPSPSMSRTVIRDRSRRRRTLPHILTSSLDNTIKVWDANTGECTKTLFGHVEGVWGLAADTFRIVSGAHDRLVKVWDIQSGKCLHTFSGHSAPVACVGLSDSRLASGSDDGEVRVYSFGVE